MTKTILFIIICLLYTIPIFFASCKTTIKRNWIDRVIFISGWIFVPFFPILFILTIFSRLDRPGRMLVWKHKPLLWGKTWEEIRRRNFYLVTEIFSFFVSLIFFFFCISYFRSSISEKYLPYILVLGIILIVIPPIILHKIFTVYERRLENSQETTH